MDGLLRPSDIRHGKSVGDLESHGEGISRFWLEEENGSEKYFDSFCSLIERLEDTRKKEIYAPGDMTNSQLIGALTPAALWTAVSAIVGLIVGSFFLGTMGAKLWGYC